MRLSKKYLYMGASLVAIYACKDFLVTPPQGALDELTLANQTGVEATLIGTYRVIGGVAGGWESSPSNWPYGSITTDDAYKGSEAADQSNANDLELYNWSGAGAHAYLNSKWASSYEGVSRANATLRLLARVQSTTPGAISTADANSIKGEALFLRALFHSEAWRMWGNIPYYTEEDADFRKANTGTDPLPLILKDLEDAIGLLPTAARSGHKGRASQWTAKAIKGRVLIESGNYTAALPVLREVANSGPFNLEPNYQRVWTGVAAWANGPETILAFQASINDGDPDGANSNNGERLNFPHSGSPLGCCGFHQPSQNLVNFFRVDDAGLPLALSVNDLTPLNATAAWNSSSANFTATNTAPVDPRLDWTVGRDGVPFKDWGTHSSTLGWVRDVSFGGTYSAKKNVHEKSSGAQSNVGWNSQHLNSVNIHIYRFADLLLHLAEAEVEAGGAAGLENARQIVNRIRRRAGVVAQGPGTGAGDIAVPIDDARITWATYRVGEYPSFPNQAYARSAVRYERRLELAMEGQRLFDLRRWNEYQPVLNEYVQIERSRRPHKTASAQVTERHRWFPIPNRQLELSTVEGASRLTQNPGW
jgi:hypothetical protein